MIFKKLAAAAVSAAMLCAAAPLSANAEHDLKTEVVEGVTYTYWVNGSYAEIASAKNACGDIYIPSTLGGATVTSIGSKAFFKEKKLEHAILPSELRYIGESAFSGCLSLELIYIPPSIVSIGSEAFMSCTSLETIIFSSPMDEIAESCFYSCPSLKNVYLPDGVKKIGAEAFFGCPSLVIEVPESVSEIGENALGKQADARTGQIVKSNGFLLKGQKGSYAEEYAAASGIDFIDLSSFTMGDINNNGKVDASDASDALAEYARASTGALLAFSPRQKIVGDMDGDKCITSKDASAILSEYSRLSTTGSSTSQPEQPEETPAESEELPETEQ